MTARPSTRDERMFVGLVLLGGLLLRLLWLMRVHGPLDGFYAAAEATNLAIAIADGRGIADAYFAGYGPTAHLLPISPAIAALPIWLFGIGSAAAVILLGWSLLQSFAAYLLFRAIFAQIGSDPRIARWGFALLCLLPPFVQQEVVDFRYWEGAGALCLAALNLLLILRFDQNRRFGWRRMLGVAALTAFTFFYCPPVGLAVDACWAWFALSRLPFAHALRFALLAACALGLTLTPWALRNAREMGEPVLTRSNFGLELAIANHPAAVSGERQAQTFADRLSGIHPAAPQGRVALKAAGGEIAYARRVGAVTWRWIGDNPDHFARLSLRHLREFFFPRPWQMYFSGWTDLRAARANMIALVNLLGLIGLALGLYRGSRGYPLLAIYIGVIALPYAFFQPTARYIYLVYPVLAYLAIGSVSAAVRAVRDRRAAASRADRAPPYPGSARQTG